MNFCMCIYMCKTSHTQSEELLSSKVCNLLFFSFLLDLFFVISPSLPKTKYTSFLLERKLIILDVVTVINRGYLNSRWQGNFNWTPYNKVKLTQCCESDGIILFNVPLSLQLCNSK